MADSKNFKINKIRIIVCAAIVALAIVVAACYGFAAHGVRGEVADYLTGKQVDLRGEVERIDVRYSLGNRLKGDGGWIISVHYFGEKSVSYQYSYIEGEVVYEGVTGEPTDGRSYGHLLDFKENVKKWETPLPAAYSYYVNEQEAVILGIGDQAMGTYALQAYRTSDGGKTWALQTDNENDFIAVSIDAEYLFISKDIGFISNPARSGDYARLLMTADGGGTFAELNLVDGDSVSLGNGLAALPKNEVYDYYELPVFEDGVLAVIVSQGGDGDFSGGKTVLEYRSEDMGGTWEFVGEYERV